MMGKLLELLKTVYPQNVVQSSCKSTTRTGVVGRAIPSRRLNPRDPDRLELLTN